MIDKDEEMFTPETSEWFQKIVVSITDEMKRQHRREMHGNRNRIKYWMRKLFLVRRRWR